MVRLECSDSFFMEFFSQREAFDAVDAENARRRHRVASGLPTATDVVDGLLGLPTDAANKRLRRMAGLFHANDILAGKAEKAPDVEQCYVRPWCWERPRPPKQPVRMYVAASPGRIWHEMQMRPMQRHVYEIIREDAPCHLYFDLEYPMAQNLGKHGDGMVEDLLHTIDSVTRAAWDLPLDRSQCIEMESSNASKWSRHLLVCFPGYAFLSALEMGNFVKHAVMKHHDASKFLVRSQQHKEVSFIDPSVYSRNRCFRCLFCKKVSMPDSDNVGASFQLTHRLTGRLQGVDEQRQWLESLACSVASTAHLLRFGSDELLRCSALLASSKTPGLFPGAAEAARLPAVINEPSSHRRSSGADCESLCQLAVCCCLQIANVSPSTDRLSHLISWTEQASVQFADVMADVTVSVKWLAGSKPSSGKLVFLRHAVPNLLDMARQLLGYDINVCLSGACCSKCCVPSISHAFKWVNAVQAANYCIWEQRFHKSNFSMLKADFWYGTFTLHCWDPECRKRHAWEWYIHPFAMPPQLQQGKPLFEEPPKLDQEEVQEYLVYADGSRDSSFRN